MKKTLYLSVIAALGITIIDVACGLKRRPAEAEFTTDAATSVAKLEESHIMTACDNWVKKHTPREFGGLIDSDFSEMLQKLGLSKFSIPASETALTQKKILKELIMNLVTDYNAKDDEKAVITLKLENLGLSEDIEDIRYLRPRNRRGEIILLTSSEEIHLNSEPSAKRSRAQKDDDK